MGEVIKLVRRGKFLGWHIRYKDADGRRKQRATHQPTREQARKYLLEVEARIARGVIGVPEPAPPAPTFGETVDRFLIEYIPRRCKRLEHYRRDAVTNLKRARAEWGSRPIDSIDSDEVARFREVLGKEYKPRTVRFTLGVLSVVFNWAVKIKLIRENPCRGVARPAVEALVEYLSRDEITRLLALAKERATTPRARMVYACLHLALHTGLRKGELAGLRWSDLDLDTRRLTVARSYTTLPKGNKVRHLRLPAACVPVLADWVKYCPRTADNLVFPVIWGGTAKMANERSMVGLPLLMHDAGCRPLKRAWHALRHTFASHFMMQGGNVLTLQKILGHTDLNHTLIYAHLAPDFLTDEMDRLKL